MPAMSMGNSAPMSGMMGQNFSQQSPRGVGMVPPNASNLRGMGGGGVGGFDAFNNLNMLGQQQPGRGMPPRGVMGQPPQSQQGRRF